jgi:hypothetical protein
MSPNELVLVIHDHDSGLEQSNSIMDHGQSIDQDQGLVECFDKNEKNEVILQFLRANELIEI